MKRAFPVFLACVLSAFAQQGYDLVVYGGTAGGVITAVSGAREGLKVALLEPRDHVGGMVSGGLTATDFGKKAVISDMPPMTAFLPKSVACRCSSSSAWA